MKLTLAPRGAMTSLAPDRVLRPVVGVDIDGTLGNWHATFFRFAEDYLQRPIPRYWDGQFSLAYHLAISKTRYRALKLAFRQSGLKRAMPLFIGAETLAYDVRQAGAELWVCTTRPYLRLDNIDPDTRWWLRHHHLTYDGVLFGERKYRDLAALVGSGRVVGIIDDLPEQVMAAKTAGLPATLVERMHNEHSLKTFGGSSLPHLFAARDELVASVRRWRKEHNV